MDPLEFYVGATFDGWPTITHPLVRLRLTDFTLELFARNSYAALVAQLTGVTSSNVDERSRTLWRSRREDLTVLGVGAVRGILLASAGDERRVRVATPYKRNMRRLVDGLSSR